jgi:hypothetical protein
MGLITLKAMSFLKVPLEGGNDVCKTSIAKGVPTLILCKPKVVRECLIRCIAGTIWDHVSFVVEEMSSLPTRR